MYRDGAERFAVCTLFVRRSVSKTYLKIDTTIPSSRFLLCELCVLCERFLVTPHLALLRDRDSSRRARRV